MIALVHRQKKKSGDGSISFPDLQCLNPVTRIATIVAEVNGERINCKVSISDMESCCPKAGPDPMKIISENRMRLESAAKRLIDAKRFEADGSILISAEDLQ